VSDDRRVEDDVRVTPSTRRILFGDIRQVEAPVAVADRRRAAIGLGLLDTGDQLPREADLARQSGVTTAAAPTITPSRSRHRCSWPNEFAQPEQSHGVEAQLGHVLDDHSIPLHLVVAVLPQSAMQPRSGAAVMGAC
jgi:hypothetical protein